MPTAASPLKPPPHDVNRIVRARERVGAKSMFNTLLPLVSDGARSSVRKLGEQLGMSSTTAWKLTNSIPLQDIANMTVSRAEAS